MWLGWCRQRLYRILKGKPLGKYLLEDRKVGGKITLRLILVNMDGGWNRLRIMSSDVLRY
jgi:hypothetical protein